MSIERSILCVFASLRFTALRGAGILLALSLFLTGCDSTATSTQPAAGEAFKIAIVVPGTTADGGWNYSAKEAAERIEQQMGVPVSFVENLEASRRRQVLRDYGRQGYHLVFCHGYEFHQVVKEIAAEAPGTRFIVSGYDQPADNFGSIVYQLGEAAYLCGVAAAKVSRSGQAGFIAAQEVPPVVLCFQGFRNGFLNSRPDGGVQPPVYIEGSNPWEDAAAAKVKTQAMLRSLAIDVLFQNADAASRGVFEAVEAHDRPIFVFGANRNQNDTPATSKIIGSAVIRVDEAFLKAARQVREGTYRPHVESETLASGVIDFVPNPKLASLVGEETANACAAAVAEARAAIIAGKIRPYGP